MCSVCMCVIVCCMTAVGSEEVLRGTVLCVMSLRVCSPGTGNGVSGWFNGVIDVDTATLNIIRGMLTILTSKYDATYDMHHNILYMYKAHCNINI